MHIPVLLHEVIEGLKIKQGDTVVDATIGGAGHAKAICERIGSSGTLIGFDRDIAAVERSVQALSLCSAKLVIVEANFRNLSSVLGAHGIGNVDAFLFDLGLSSHQLEESGRGFSFQRDEPLKMTFETNGKLSAETVVNDWSEESLADIIWGFGGERAARKIAKAIAEAREKKRIISSKELAEIVSRSIGGKQGRIHPATKTFQALRIAVNDELGALKDGLLQGFETLGGGGRMAVISFHEAEDRIVKQLFKSKNEEGKAELITKKTIQPGREEILKNPRSRSAKLRILQKI